MRGPRVLEAIDLRSRRREGLPGERPGLAHRFIGPQREGACGRAPGPGEVPQVATAAAPAFGRIDDEPEGVSARYHTVHGHLFLFVRTLYG